MSAGMLRLLCDWLAVQRIDGSREGELETHELPIPDEHFGGARRGRVQEMYKHVFREQDTMARAFVSAIARGEKTSPDFADVALLSRKSSRTAGEEASDYRERGRTKKTEGRER